MTFSKPFITVMRRRNTTPLERMLLPSKPASSSPHPTSSLSIADVSYWRIPLLGRDGRRALSTAITRPRQGGFRDLDRDSTCINVEGGINMAGISRLASSSVTRPQPTKDVNGRMFSSIPINFNLSSHGSGKNRFGSSNNSNGSGNNKQSNEEAKKSFSTTSPPTSPTMAAKSTTNNSSNSSSSRSSGDNVGNEIPSSSSSDPATQPKTKQSFRSMVRQYGPVFVGTYLTVYVSTVSAFFVGIESGALDPAYVLSFLTAAGDGDAEFQTTAQVVARLLDHYSWTRPAVPYIQDHPAAANFAVAWLATKPTEPIRFGLTVALVPTVARTFGYAGSSSSSNSSSNNSTSVPETKDKDELGGVAGPTKKEPTKVN